MNKTYRKNKPNFSNPVQDYLKDKALVQISKGDLKKLVFWAHVGTSYAQGGSHSKEIPKIIVKMMNKLKLKPHNFCCFKNPDFNKLARDVYFEWCNTKEKEGSLK